MFRCIHFWCVISNNFNTYLLSTARASGGTEVRYKVSQSRSFCSQRHDIVVIQVLLSHLDGHRLFSRCLLVFPYLFLQRMSSRCFFLGVCIAANAADAHTTPIGGFWPRPRPIVDQSSFVSSPRWHGRTTLSWGSSSSSQARISSLGFQFPSVLSMICIRILAQTPLCYWRPYVLRRKKYYVRSILCWASWTRLWLFNSYTDFVTHITIFFDLAS